MGLDDHIFTVRGAVCRHINNKGPDLFTFFGNEQGEIEQKSISTTFKKGQVEKKF